MPAWQADMDARGLSDRVLEILERFGRRLRDNDSGRDDHGAGGHAPADRERENGGIRREFTGLTQLEPTITRRHTDFRSV